MLVPAFLIPIVELDSLPLLPWLELHCQLNFPIRQISLLAHWEECVEVISYLVGTHFSQLAKSFMDFWLAPFSILWVKQVSPPGCNRYNPFYSQPVNNKYGN